MYDDTWAHLAHCSWDVPGLRIAGVVHSGDVTHAPYPNGGRETCTIDIPALIEGFPKARYVVLTVYSFTRQQWDDLDDASVFVANPHARGSGPGGMAVVAAARLTGASTTSIGGYLDLAPHPLASSPVEPATKPMFGIKGSTRKSYAEAVKTEQVARADVGVELGTVGVGRQARRVHFVFADQALSLEYGAYHATGSTSAVGTILSKMEESRIKGGAQTLADAAAFQAALVCDRVIVLPEIQRGGEGEDGERKVSAAPATGVTPAGDWKTLSKNLVRGATEGRFQFYERLSAALKSATPAAPAAGKEGVGTYPVEALRGDVDVSDSGWAGGESVRKGTVHTVFFGGDLDDWLQVTREHGMSRPKVVEAAVPGGADDERGASSGGEIGDVGKGQDDWEAPRRGSTGDTLTLVNLHSVEKGLVKQRGCVTRVNGATAYTELAEAVLHGRGHGGIETVGTQEG